MGTLLPALWRKSRGVTQRLVPMREGYHDPDSSRPEQDCPFSDLDELLCEYVDGTMDPAVRQVFEEYLRANPTLARHVECLCRTRQLLCQHGACKLRAPEGFQARLRQRLAYEMMRERQSLEYLSLPLRSATTLASAVALLVILGMCTGVLLYLEQEPETPGVVVQATRPEPSAGFQFEALTPVRTERRVLPGSYRPDWALSAAWNRKDHAPIHYDTLQTMRFVQRSHGAP